MAVARVERKKGMRGMTALMTTILIVGYGDGKKKLIERVG
jgi:hypothetical protein